MSRTTCARRLPRSAVTLTCWSRSRRLRLPRAISLCSASGRTPCALTEELFRYSVLTATADELHTEPVCLNDVLEQSLAGFYGALSARGITPSVQLPEEKVIRPLDAAALRRVFDNILSNAAKYSDGDLAVVLAPDGKVTFSNRASALSRVEAARLFDRFYTVDSARGSTGLGLSIAKLLTEKLHGTISADYENETLRICIAFPTEKQGGI